MEKENEVSRQTNIEKLVAFTEEKGPDLIPIFLAMIEMCFYSHKNSF